MLSPGHALITGASAGIGAALARAYSREGLAVTLVARRKDLLEALAAELGQAVAIEADLSDPGAAEQIIAEATEAQGPIDHLVNNAGRQIVEYGHEIDPEQGEAMLKLNLLTPLRLLRGVVPRMRERGRGSVVNVSSVAGYATPHGMAWYGASKAGLATASETMHGELAPSGVHVVTVYPGPIETEMGRYGDSRIEPTWGSRMQRWGTAERLADLVIEAVKKKRARVVYPKTYGPARHAPGAVRWALDHLSPSLRRDA